MRTAMVHKKEKKSLKLGFLLLLLLLLDATAAPQIVSRNEENNNSSSDYNASVSTTTSTWTSLHLPEAPTASARSLLVQEPSPAPRADGDDDDESCDDIGDVPQELKCDFFHNTTECEEDGKAVFHMCLCLVFGVGKLTLSVFLPLTYRVMCCYACPLWCLFER